jgi:hypothetical protein
MTIKNKKGNMITAAAENKEITRNSSFFKKIGKPVLCDLSQGHCSFHSFPVVD